MKNRFGLKGSNQGRLLSIHGVTIELSLPGRANESHPLGRALPHRLHVLREAEERGERRHRHALNCRRRHRRRRRWIESNATFFLPPFCDKHFHFKIFGFCDQLWLVTRRDFCPIEHLRQWPT